MYIKGGVFSLCCVIFTIGISIAAKKEVAVPSKTAVLQTTVSQEEPTLSAIDNTYDTITNTTDEIVTTNSTQASILTTKPSNASAITNNSYTTSAPNKSITITSSFESPSSIYNRKSATTKTTVSSSTTISTPVSTSQSSTTLTPTFSTSRISKATSSSNQINTSSTMIALPETNGTSSASSLYSPSTIIETTSTSASAPEYSRGPSPGMLLAIFLSIGFVVVVGGLTVAYQRKKRNYIPCSVRTCTSCLTKVRTRRSSTGSHGPLTQDDTISADFQLPKQDRELFSINDQDGGEDGRPGARRERRGTEDDYFYDEIFERSAFVDETTNRSNKQLTLEDDTDDELDIPDLVFKGSASRY